MYELVITNEQVYTNYRHLEIDKWAHAHIKKAEEHDSTLQPYIMVRRSCHEAVKLLYLAGFPCI